MVRLLLDLQIFCQKEIKPWKRLKNWLKNGMPYYKVNRCIRVRVDEFNGWMSRFRGGTSNDLDAILDQVMREV